MASMTSSFSLILRPKLRHTEAPAINYGLRFAVMLTQSLNTFVVPIFRHSQTV